MADDSTDPENTDTEATDDAATIEADSVVDGSAPDASTTIDDAGVDTKPKSKGPAAAKTAPAGNVVRKKVVSKRVTPKGGPVSTKSGNAKPQSKAAKAKAVADDDEHQSRRYTPPSSHNDMLPSPWWVPALMFGLLILGAVIIMANYMGAFGDAENIRLVIGLAFILGGIITATQYR
ncbi:MAG: cell division protein CrgA [Aquihabitans sp.]